MKIAFLLHLIMVGRLRSVRLCCISCSYHLEDMIFEKTYIGHKIVF